MEKDQAISEVKFASDAELPRLAVNKHGLKRYVPADIRREIRKRAGFGCVICGLGFYDYEHFDPNFADATEHNPDGMTLLCMQCNQKRARRQLSRERVAKAGKAPYCLQAGYTREALDLSGEAIEVTLGNVRFLDFANLVTIGGEVMLAIRKSGDLDEPLLLSGKFTDIDHNITLHIEDNQWISQTGNWDVEVVGPQLTIRRGPSDIALRLRTQVPDKLYIERLSMKYKNWWLEIDSTSGIRRSSDGGKLWGGMSNMTLKGTGLAGPGAVHFMS